MLHHPLIASAFPLSHALLKSESFRYFYYLHSRYPRDEKNTTSSREVTLTFSQLEWSSNFQFAALVLVAVKPMEAWAVEPRYVPRKLYRVDYQGTWSRYIPEHGFEAAIFTHPSDLSAYPALISSIEDHLNWSSGVLSPFISLFSEKRHAENWAQIWMNNNPGRACLVFEINGTKLDRVAFLFRPYYMKTRLGAEIDNSWIDPHELLCLHHIPEDAILGYLFVI